MASSCIGCLSASGRLRAPFRIPKYKVSIAEIVHDCNEDAAYQLGHKIVDMCVLHEGINERSIDPQSDEDDDEE